MLQLDYDQYINSPRWRRRKVEYFARHNRLCRLCGKGKDIHLHHLTYERMGAELDSDLMPLCQRCHDIVHQYAKRKPNLSLADATLRAIKEVHTQKKARRRVPPPFVPLNQRPDYCEPQSGREGRLGGLPVIVEPRK